MQAKSRIKKKKNNASLVPLLFTLGVIGWGFFAIDRLTSSGAPDYRYNPVESSDISPESYKERTRWKMKIENYLKSFSISGKSASEKNAKDIQDEQWTPVTPEEVSPQPEQIADVEKIDLPREYKLFFYEEKGRKLELRSVSRKNSGDVSLQQIFMQLISGPSFIHNKNFIDSFPVKPTVLKAFVREKTMIIDMDDNFGHGVSFETAQLQIDQIVQTSIQFHVNSVQFLINGEKVDSIQADGLSIPALIKTNSSL
ncbi:MAG: GerMN domain-containing protein [Spirochaetia bacterium]|nr:GerMN domain-containing protein [Spirochaetia bacterium]